MAHRPLRLQVPRHPGTSGRRLPQALAPTGAARPPRACRPRRGPASHAHKVSAQTAAGPPSLGNPAARFGRPGPMHPLACRGAVGYNQQANGRFALLWLVHLCAGRPAGTAAHPTGGCPLSRANLPASYQGIRPRARSASARTAAARSSCVRSVMGTLLSPAWTRRAPPTFAGEMITNMCSLNKRRGCP